ncbi:transmembrane protein 45B-like [Glandiceps talaboti]
MGTFEGHALPGSFFMCFGIWWCIKFSYRLIYPKTRKTANEQLGLARCNCSVEAELVEGIIIVIMTFIGFIAEQSWPYKKWAMFDYHIDPPGRFVNGAEWQHCTMYTFFGIFGAVSIMARTCVPGLKAYEMFFGALAFFVEGLLFYFHVHGRSSLDITLHYLLVIAVVLGSITAMAEMWKKDDKLLPFIRTGLTMIQGTWFWQVGFMLYPPNGEEWDQESHNNVMFATMAFCWHIAANILIMAGLYGIVSFCVHTRRAHSIDRELEVELLSVESVFDNN